MLNMYRGNEYPEAARFVHARVLNGFYDLSIGMAEQLGKFTLSMLSTGDIAKIMSLDWDLDQRPVAAIMEEMSTRFVRVTLFTNVNKLWEVWGLIEKDYDRYFNGEEKLWSSDSD